MTVHVNIRVIIWLRVQWPYKQRIYGEDPQDASGRLPRPTFGLALRINVHPLVVCTGHGVRINGRNCERQQRSWLERGGRGVGDQANGSDFRTLRLRGARRRIVLQTSQDGHWRVPHRRVTVEGAY